MPRSRCVLALAVAVSCGAALRARADFQPGPGSAGAPATLLPLTLATADAAFWPDTSGSVEAVGWTPFSSETSQIPVDESVPAGGHALRELRQLPRTPGSAALLLSALVSVGAWQLVRSAKNLSLDHLPAWYHSGAPEQIGHAVAFDFYLAALPCCTFEQPAQATPTPDLPADWRVPYLPTDFLTNASRRGPPRR